MKKYDFKKLIICIWLLWIYGCNNSNKTTKDQPDNSIEITTTKTESYCGGAQPSEETLKKLREPKAYPNATLYLREGEENNYKKPYYKKLKSDSVGKVNVNLPKGVYSVVFDNKSGVKKYNQILKSVEKSSSHDTIDKKCLENYFTKPDGLIVVTDSLQKVTINRHFPCEWESIPCSYFSGGLPPSIQSK